jgi:hypothetical protein
LRKETHILMLICAVLVILLILCLGGCAAQSAQNADIIYAKGGCLLVVDGLLIEQMDEKSKQWVFDENCKISVKTVVD